MENKQIQESKNQDDDLKTIQDQANKSNLDEHIDSPSRFSRRRFIRSAAISSPILLSVKSPVAWSGGLYSNQCSIVSQLSGNASHPNNCQVSAKAPEYWIKTFTGQNDAVKQAVNDQGCYDSTLFHTLFPHQLSSYQKNRRISKKWRYRLSLTSDNPSLLQSLTSRDGGLWVEFENTNSREKIRVNLLYGVNDFHCCLTSGYLNGLFHPSPVNYIGDASYIKNAFKDTLNRSINTVLRDLSRNRYWGSNPAKYSLKMKELSNGVSTWDQV